MKRKFIKICVAAMSISVLSVVSVFAFQSRNVNYNDQPFSTYYMDDYNVSHHVSGTASVDAAVGWDEGYSGWIISAYFPKPCVTIDGMSADINYVGTTEISGSSAYQEFSINNTTHSVRPTVVCDEYGDTYFWVKSW